MNKSIRLISKKKSKRNLAFDRKLKQFNELVKRISMKKLENVPLLKRMSNFFEFHIKREMQPINFLIFQKNWYNSANFAKSDTNEFRSSILPNYHIISSKYLSIR